jgi:hypothetical protein
MRLKETEKSEENRKRLKESEENRKNLKEYKNSASFNLLYF